jgi:hypothetical protein
MKPDGDKEIKRQDHAVAIRKPKKWCDVQAVISDVVCARFD